ncbi:hypothetical protein LAY39_04230 [Escherichia coli]|nr:hypothetical protein [Escherichia coli]HBN0246940.1 hypothetical protein [Escherichia coli]
MTTNNHPAHGPVSLDRLHQIREILSKAAAQSDGGNIGYAMADAVKVIDVAIASFGAEPVAWIAKKKTTGEMELDEPHAKATNPKYWTDAFPVYTTPQAPVVPEEMFNNIDNPYGDEDLIYEQGKIEGWNACRAAMLQVRNHTEQHLDMVGRSGDANQKADCKLPFDQWLSQQNEPIDVDCGCVTTEAFYHWLRVAYEDGNSPVAQDGWQLVPKEPTEAMNKAGWAAMNEHDAINPTYRAMLAAAPQQENV